MCSNVTFWFVVYVLNEIAELSRDPYHLYSCCYICSWLCPPASVENVNVVGMERRLRSRCTHRKRISRTSCATYVDRTWNGGRPVRSRCRNRYYGKVRLHTTELDAKHNASVVLARRPNNTFRKAHTLPSSFSNWSSHIQNFDYWGKSIVFRSSFSSALRLSVSSWQYWKSHKYEQTSRLIAHPLVPHIAIAIIMPGRADRTELTPEEVESALEEAKSRGLPDGWTVKLDVRRE